MPPKRTAMHHAGEREIRAAPRLHTSHPVVSHTSYHIDRSNRSEIAWTPNVPPSSSSSRAERIVPFRSVSLSAIATDASDRACLYLQIDDGSEALNGESGAVGGETANGEVLNGKGEVDPLEVLSEMFLVFAREDDLHKAFEAMCQGALRNPDSDDDDGDDVDGLGGWFGAGSLAEGLEASVGLGDSDQGDAAA